MGINSCGNTGHSIPIQVHSRFHSKFHDAFNSCPLPVGFRGIPIPIRNPIPMITSSANPIRRVWPDRSVFRQHLFWFWLNSDSANKHIDINLPLTSLQFRRCSCPTLWYVYLQPIFCAHIPSLSPSFSFIFYAISGRTINGLCICCFPRISSLVSSSLSILIILLSCN